MNSISARRRLLALLLLPFLVVLAGCGKFHAEIEVADAETINVHYDLAIDEEIALLSFPNAEAMCEARASSGAADETAPEMRPYEEDGQFGCEVTGVITSDKFGSLVNLTEENGEYHLTIRASQTSAYADPAMADLGIDFKMTFTFPGEVTEANGGTIDGNTGTYTDLSELSQGIDIRADAGSFPWVIVIVVVLVLGFFLLLLIAAAVFFVIRSRKNKGGGSTPVGVPAAYGSAAAMGSGGSPAPQGQPGQQGEPWGQPGQSGQPWGQASPPPAPPAMPGQQAQPGQQGQPGQQDQPWSQPPQDQSGQQPWAQPGDQQDPPQWGPPGQGQQPPQNPGW